MVETGFELRQSRVRVYYLFLFIYLAVLGLPCLAQAFSSCGQWGLLFIMVRVLLFMVTPLALEHRISSCNSQAPECRLSSHDAQA